MKNYKTVTIDKKKLQKIIAAHGLTLTEAADLVGKAPSYFALRKQGEPETISVTTAKAIEGALGIKLEAYQVKTPARVPVYTAPDYETPEQLAIDTAVQFQILDYLKQLTEDVSDLADNLAVLTERSGRPVPDNDPDW